MPELDDAVVTRSIINRSVSRYEGNAKTIRPYAFAACANLLEVVCPSCSSIGSVAFNGCYALSAISFPECQVIAQYAFQSCDSLVVASFPNCRLLYSYVFNGLSSLREVYLPLLSRCSGTSTTAVNMFAYCPNLEYVDLPIYQLPFYYSLSTIAPSALPILQHELQFILASDSHGVYASDIISAVIPCKVKNIMINWDMSPLLNVLRASFGSIPSDIYRISMLIDGAVFTETSFSIEQYAQE